MQQTALAQMLAHIGRLKVLTAAIADASDTEAQTLLDARAAVGKIDMAPQIRSEIAAAIQRSASKRRADRRIGASLEIVAIGTALASLAPQAQSELLALVEELRANEIFVPEDRHLFERFAA